MTARLVPYRSLNQVAADANVMMVLLAAGAAAIGLTVVDPLTKAVAVWFAIVAAVLLSEAIATRRARLRGAEQVTRQEWYERTFAERAAQPVWRSVGDVGLHTSFTALVLSLALLPMSLWSLAAVGSAVAAILGGIGGAYAWTTARARLSAQSAGSPLAASPFVQIAMRHYAGYANGLSSALFAAAFVDGETWKPAVVLTAFVAGKVVSDAIVPAIIYNTAVDVPHSIGRLVRGCIFAVFWWGLPLGAALALAVSDKWQSWHDAAFVFGATSVGAVAFLLVITAMLYVTRGRVASSAPER
ncbi:MAG: hypothetical protein KBA31_16130 [Alphaproteobacteria bacterium]|nr:hypothetical protein [Alphaproteobacteria bacterium]